MSEVESDSEWANPPPVVQDEDEDLFGEGKDQEQQDDIFVKEATPEPEPEPELEAVQQKISINISVPEQPRVDAAECFVLKVPNFLAVDPVEYKYENFEPLVQDADDPDDSAQKARHRLQHTIRWRQGSQSNARLCKWNDGSQTIKVGHKHFPISTSKQHSHIYFKNAANILETDTRTFVVRKVMTATPNGVVYNLQGQQEQEAKSKTRFISEFNDPQAGRKMHEQLEQQKLKQQRLAQTRERRSRHYDSDEEDDLLLLGRQQQPDAAPVADEYDKDFVVDDDEGLEEYEDEDDNLLEEQVEDLPTPKKAKMVIDDDDSSDNE